MLFNYLLNKAIVIKRINPEEKLQPGDIDFDGTSIKVRFKWRLKSFSPIDVRKILAYWSVDFGLENEYSNINMIFKDGCVVYLDGTKEEHRLFTDKMLIANGLKPNDWSKPLPPNVPEKEEMVLLYNKSS